MNHQSIKRLRLGRGKTPPGSRTEGLIKTYYQPETRAHFTYSHDVIPDDLEVEVDDCNLLGKRSLYDWQIGVEKRLIDILMPLGKLSRLAVHPLPPERNTVVLLASLSFTSFPI